MLTLAGAYTSHAAQETTEFCTLWKVTRSDSTVFRFTDHDRDVEMSDGTYLASSGYVASQARTQAGLNVDDVEVTAVFDAAAITETDLSAGLWDGATVEIFSAIWSLPSAGARMIRKGTIGQVRHDGVVFRAELRGMMDRLSANVGRIFGPACDAELGDSRCGVSLTAFTHSLTVTSVTSRTVFADSALDDSATPAGYFDGGLIEWLTGANAGRSMEIKLHATGGVFTLFLPMVSDIAVGDTATVIAGCDKSFGTCRDVFNNVVNFRGFPSIPGNDRLFAPNTR
jgi:uncharacterized phage protein (TIGR02218 family)